MLSFTYFVALVSIIAAIIGVQAAPSTELAVLESLPAIPEGWHQGYAPPASKRLRFRIAVALHNAYDFEQHVIAISTPRHPKYGQHMSREELRTMLRPSTDATEAIVGWLNAEGVPADDIQDAGDWINFWVPTMEAERILDTRFHYYESVTSGVERIRTLHYSVPTKLHQYIQMIQPTTRFGQMHGERSQVIDSFKVGPSRSSYYDGSKGLNVTFCNTTITPQCLKELYNVGDFKPSAHNGMYLAIHA